MTGPATASGKSSMPNYIEATALKDLVGQVVGTSEWVDVTQ